MKERYRQEGPKMFLDPRGMWMLTATHEEEMRRKDAEIAKLKAASEDLESELEEILRRQKY